MDEMEWGQAKRIALDIYGDIDVDKDLEPDVKTIIEMIETEDDELDRVIDTMLTILPRVEEEYLVSGARLKCSLATMDTIDIDGVKFHTKKNGTSLLQVENRDKIGDVSKANIYDCEKQKNILQFGNCKAILSESEKKMLKANATARQEGMCYCLMNISGPWENEPTKGRMEYFKYHGYPGINGMSKLFCYKRGKIMAMTSGQENRDLSVNNKAVTKEDLQFAFRNGVSGEKICALADIREYLAKYPQLEKKTTIFAFEGLADYYPYGNNSVWNGYNEYHPDGQFGAILFVAKEGKLTYFEGHASTLPDNMKQSAIVCEGVYQIKSIKHKLQEDYVDPYASIRLCDINDSTDDTLSAYNSKHKDDTAVAINLHMAGKISPGKGTNTSDDYSTGCLTVPVCCYRDFGVEVGFIKAEGTEGAGSDNKYSKAKKELLYDNYAIRDFTGYIVIDRQYYEDTEGYLKYNGPKGNE